jgi:calcium-dependent protein kinase
VTKDETRDLERMF